MTWYVPEMHCERCVERITNALRDIGVTCSVALAQKTVTADGDKAAIVEALDDLGFTAQEV